MLRMGIDIGGTFTDLVLVNDASGELWITKVLTTYSDPAVGVSEAVRQALGASARAMRSIDIVIHGTTLATNTVIERKGSMTALLATRGHRDALEIRREHRYVMYDVLIEMPQPLAPRHLRFDVDERVSARGEVLAPLDTAQVERLIRRLAERGTEAVAVCFLHSYRNPVHEEAVLEIAQKSAPNMRVSLSSRVAPEIKEYERTSTTVCNAYIQARVDTYLRRLEDELRVGGFAGSFFMIQSSGGLITAETAREHPVRILESGPAGGALAAAQYARSARRDAILSFDMGGTTAKLAVINNGEPLVAPGFEVDRVYRFARGSGLPARVPAVEMIEIGAGGGSIARVDSLGLIRVGPDSAGADPGPACYGRGGEDPTVTDADLLLGYLDAGYFLGGTMKLSVESARRAVEKRLADRLGVDVTRAAWGIHRLVNENMAGAARVHLTDRGEDPISYPLFAFGGAGPVHAYGVAKILGSPAVVVPFGAGVCSAMGFLTAPLSFEYVQGWHGRLANLEWEAINSFLSSTEQRGRLMLRRAGVAEPEINTIRSCDIRYEGQGFEVKIGLPDGTLGEGSVSEIRHRFDARYEDLYGRTVSEVGLEVVNWRIVVHGPRPHLRTVSPSRQINERMAATKGSRPAYFPDAGGFIETPLFDRYRLPVGAVVTGPAIVEERESTVVVGPDARLTVDEERNLVVDLAHRDAPARERQGDHAG